MSLSLYLTHLDIGIGEYVEKIDMCSDGLFDKFFQIADGLLS